MGFNEAGVCFTVCTHRRLGRLWVVIVSRDTVQFLRGPTRVAKLIWLSYGYWVVGA